MASHFALFVRGGSRPPTSMRSNPTPSFTRRLRLDRSLKKRKRRDAAGGIGFARRILPEFLWCFLVMGVGLPSLRFGTSPVKYRSTPLYPSGSKSSLTFKGFARLSSSKQDHNRILPEMTPAPITPIAAFRTNQKQNSSQVTSSVTGADSLKSANPPGPSVDLLRSV